ncbi:MAG: hypothetical protein QNJ69_11075 [Gammaproteobacteria bacterium]|nr:hypothetical protein [Gammaproteobacteria bacterium]
MHKLEQLRGIKMIVADTGDIDSSEQSRPTDNTEQIRQALDGIMKFFGICSGLVAMTVIGATQASAAELIHVRLQDRLDRPQDGYCLDILGNARNLRVDLPLFAHNCKSGPTADSSMIYTQQGQLVFPEANVCVTAFGVNTTVLSGTSVLLRPCAEQTPFFNSSSLQRFDYQANGQFELRGYGLCLAVGEESSRTYSPFDRWRVLSLESCEKISLQFSAWEMIQLN